MNNTTQSRVSLVVPADRVLDVMETLLALQVTLRADGVDSKLEIKHRLGGRDAGHDAVVPDANDAETLHPAVAVAGGAVEGGTPETPATRHTVLYRVINPRIRVGQIPHNVRMFILQHGPATAKEIETTLNMGRKSVESALHKLRTDGSVESVQDVGQVITQRKFDARAIRMGVPVV